MKRYTLLMSMLGLWGGLAVTASWLFAQGTPPPAPPKAEQADGKTSAAPPEQDNTPKLIHLEFKMVQVPASFAKKVDEQIRKQFSQELEQKGFVKLTSAEVTRLTEAAQTEPSANLMFAPEINTVDNQAATLKVEDMLALACRPTLSKDGKELTLTLEANARVDAASGKALCNFKTTQSVDQQGTLLVKGTLTAGQKSELTYWLLVTAKVADQ